MDFLNVKEKVTKTGIIIYPDFKVIDSKDLMIRGKTFYAIWDEKDGLWKTNELDAIRLIDESLYEASKKYGDGVTVVSLKNYSSKKFNEWQNYCRSIPDNYHDLDAKVIFLNDKVSRFDYATKRLPYAIGEGTIESYDEIIGTLYSPEERRKIEWAIGSIIAGDSVNIQKFIVMYGAPGTGKSTILKIIERLFEGYCSPFDSKSIGSSTNTFALEAFRNNPLIAIQHDGDLSRIEDNTRINSIVSHEVMLVNEKFKSPYKVRFRSFLIMGTNKPVKITDAKSGIIRRLIDVVPTGEKIPKVRYEQLLNNVKFELGAIANHCLRVYQKLGPNYYDAYVPIRMISITNDFYNFINDNYDYFVIENPEMVTLGETWKRYKEYCEDANIPYAYTKRVFKSELMNYYKSFRERYKDRRNVFIEFRIEKLNQDVTKDVENLDSLPDWLDLGYKESTFDKRFANCPAQLANEDGNPNYKWDRCKLFLKDIDTSKLHYVLFPSNLNLIMVDFDLKDDKGNKDARANLEAASKWPPTYAEFSKSQAGVHLYYFYNGDVTRLSRYYDKDIEIKIPTGKSAIRRMLTKCNDLAIATISSGLLLKEVKKVINKNIIDSEKTLREMIRKNLRKEIWPNTKPSIDFIYKLLNDAHDSGIPYDVTDMRHDIQCFAMGSTHQAEKCLTLVSRMPFKSDEIAESVSNNNDSPFVIFDTEVYPNLFLICWKKYLSDMKPVRMYNPTASEVEDFLKFKLVGFNNRDYDNHILYARSMGYTNKQLFELSNRIIKNGEGRFGSAYNLSELDVYDMLMPNHRMGLKKWEIKLGIFHQELDFPWDEPIDEKYWDKVGDYCCNDVIATEEVLKYTQEDFTARKILSDLSGLSLNDKTNSHTIKIIVGDDPNPQSKFNYVHLEEEFPGYRYDPYGIPKEDYILGTKIVSGKSIYKGVDPGEGGYVYAVPGIYVNVDLLDINSMHPMSIIVMNMFGPYTKNFKDIVDTRLYIKHGDFESCRHLLNGKLIPYLKDESKAKELSMALKGAINPVYGLTSAKFPNKLRDPRNIDNIVAKRGSLFMIDLKEALKEQGYNLIHVKTDSVKIANSNPGIVQFVIDFGKKYGYSFDYEASYDRICLVNESTYIAKYKEPKIDKKTGKEIWWTATGAQFQVPFVFKVLFSKEPIEFEDLCETKTVQTSMYLDMNERLNDVSQEEKELEKIMKNVRNGKVDEDDPKIQKLKDVIKTGHDYRFVGKVGLFCPVKAGCGGGILLRKTENGKFGAVNGSLKKNGEPYRWMEASQVKLLGGEDLIDLNYYYQLCDEAVDTINKFGIFDRFVSDKPYNDLPFEEDIEEIPFD